VCKGLESQPTCHGNTSYKPAEASPGSTQVNATPVASSMYRSGSDWSKRGRTTPDILAEIMVRSALLGKDQKLFQIIWCTCKIIYM